MANAIAFFVVTAAGHIVVLVETRTIIWKNRITIWRMKKYEYERNNTERNYATTHG